MRPKFRVEINGKDMAGPLWERLVSLSITDKEGSKSDTLDIELDDGPPKFLELPSKRATFKVWGGYEETGLVYFGTFKDGDITVNCLPYGISISAKASDMKEGLKNPQERHWDNKTIGQVFTDLANENGLIPQIAPEIAAKTFSRGWAAMQNESVLAFGRRMGSRIGAQFQVKDGKLILVPKGQAKTAKGRDLTALKITPEILQPGSCSFEFKGRDKYSKVKATYHDAQEAKRKTVEAELTDSLFRPEDGAELTIRESFGSQKEAEEAAKAKARDLSAEADSAKATIVGDVRARGGAPFVFERIHPGLDGVPFIVESATHKFDKSGGYTTDIQGKAKK